MKLEWIETSGGPLLCASPTIARLWRGTDGSSAAAINDYERACKSSNYLSKIPCGSSEILVLGDEPLLSAFVQRGSELVVVRWVSCLSMDLASTAISSLPHALPVVEAAVDFVTLEADLVLFDSALNGAHLALSARATVLPSAFRVTTEKYKAHDQFEFLIHRFLPSV